MRSMGHPDYVYCPISDEARRRLSEAQKRRLGIPVDCVRIYGTIVPECHAEPLRSYAAWVALKRGNEAAASFVANAAKNRWSADRPVYEKRIRPRILFGVEIPAPAAATIAPYAKRMASLKKYGRAMAEEFLRRAEASGWVVDMPDLVLCGGRQRDWSLVETLLDEGMSRQEVADFLSVSLLTLRNNLRRRHRDGLSSYGSGPRIWREQWDAVNEPA